MPSYEDRLERYFRGSPSVPRQPALATRLLFHAVYNLERRIEEVVAPFGLSMREYLALAILNTRGGEAIQPSELSASLDATRTQITRLLDGLEQRSLIKRKPKVEDRRGLELELTAAGRKLFAQASPAMHEAYRSWWSGFEPAALDGMIQGLRALNKATADEGEE
ncbi:MarR family transcriptional regulator [Ramlibacter sp. G-1-2-2]|uniref:MarR family transcriptional regulator n=1 Tax=Ramlibacter agri TaxID=2728837 RepID=A0A848HH59_9BURK|nr:MarR family transcriptional regulator [Ramlibacter agri]NML48661.1 MarR family transcriptional regulator [Ramlibacter agri]